MENIIIPKYSNIEEFLKAYEKLTNMSALSSLHPGIAKELLEESIYWLKTAIPKQVIYFAVGPYCWGKGFSEDQAIRAAKEEWNIRGGKYSKTKLALYKTNDTEIYVDDFGYIMTRQGYYLNNYRRPKGSPSKQEK